MPPAPAALALSPGEVSPHGWLPTGGRRSNKCSAPLGARWGNVGWVWDHICHRFGSKLRVLVPLAEAIFKSLYFEILPMPFSRTRSESVFVAMKFTRVSQAAFRSSCWHQGVKSDTPHEASGARVSSATTFSCHSCSVLLGAPSWHSLGGMVWGP